MTAMPEKEPEVLFDVVVPSPGQQKILDLLTKMVAGGFILWKTGEELFTEISKYRTTRSKIAMSSILRT